MKARSWIAALLLGSALLPQAQAVELRWPGRSFQIVAADKPLPDFLRELAASQGTTAVIDAKVSGVISGKFAGAPLQTLDSVCTTNGLAWYFDGAFLFVEPASEARSEVLAVNNATRVADTLHRLGVGDARFPMTVVDREGRGAIHVAGPKRYLEIVKQTIKLADAPMLPSEVPEIRVFPLKYAWAADLTLPRGGKELAVPGVASALRGLYAKASATTALSPRAAVMPFRLGGQRRLKLRSGDTVDAPKIELPTGIGSGSEEPAAAPGEELPQFQADARINAVIVRDLPARMPQYARLIESMDLRPRLVEIEVTIMDIGTDTLHSLGIDWRLHGKHLDLQLGRGNGTPLTFDGQNAESGAGSGTTGAGGQPLSLPGALLNVAIGHDARNYLLARVHALAQRGNANFVARPKVLTLDNIEAVLENQTEFHVRVNGFQDAGLFSVTAGTAVRVTPKVIDDGTPGVMMSIHIDDGDLSAAAVDQIPVVRRRAIQTQALVDEGQSLLIAGYTSEEKSNATTGVPLLSDLPVIGRAFRFEEKKQVSMERFYLLTPRLVSARSAASARLPAQPSN
ncbi:type III secretion system outer membrane ring subunit SctC [Aquincola sp. S2]|uniref:Type 3 secretion system secretin n=1 Tax=Pseudaquabacterium terrae TaxID=2732868 RepID=A0ABX2ELC2_9BURK|nr:type III secretion system outer membrane ring subunit SctC [Aquabacterium terrae]NRF69425.1 type III secretion system outer membrane ring subunit SctC [Aquabacterium terrae]